MAKKSKSATQFPRIYRLITEKSGFPLFLASTLFLIVLIALLLFQFAGSYQYFLKISAEREALNSKVSFWSSVLDKFPGFADASFNVASLYYSLGNFQKSRIFLDKTLIYNPGYENSKVLDRDLKSRGY